MLLSPRTEIYTHEPNRVGDGTSRSWRRTIGANVYAFTVVNMPSGDLRLYVKVYNGYGDGTPEGREIGMRFSCAWSVLHSITFKARGMSLDDATRHAEHLCDVYPVDANDEHIGVIERIDGTRALVSGHPQYGERWLALADLTTSCKVAD